MSALGKSRFVPLPALAATLALTALTGGRSAVADFVERDSPPPQAAKLAGEDERRADAMAFFVRGLIDEESEGPETAIESFRKTLQLDPGNTTLAIRLSQDYLRRGDSVQAIAVLKDALKARPRNTEVALSLGLVYLRHLQKPDLALKYVQQALQADRGSLAAYDAMWEIHQSRGQAEKAAAVFGLAAKSESKDPAFWLGLAELISRRAVRDAGRLSEGTARQIRTHLERAIEVAGGDAGALVRAGDQLALAAEVGGATTAYERAYALKASLPLLRQKLVACYVEQGRLTDAIRMLDELVKLNPLDIEAYDQLSALHLREGNLRQAADNARQALIIEPRTVERHLLVIDLLFRLQDFSAATDTLAEARKLFRGSPRLAYFHGLALSQCDRHDEAIRAFAEAEEEAARVEPAILNADFYFDYGASAERAGDFAKAAGLLRRSIELDPSSAARAYNYLGYMWVDRGENLEEAGEMIRRAVEMEPQNGAYVDSLGWLYYRRGEYEEALGTLLRAAGLLSEPDAVVFDHIGDACAKLGRTAEAVLYWNKALALDAENAEVAAKIEASTEKVAGQQKPAKTH